MEEIKKIKINDNDYPALLRKISDPPKVLYVKGNLDATNYCFAVVGTRKYSAYGKQVTFDIVGKLLDAGLTIVSGLAPGIDTFVHQICVEKKKKTIAVLGTGLDEKSIYPQSNLSLVKKILEIGGCLISEYPPGTPGSKFSFPKRNRIIAGISLGVLIIEAKNKSGSLITADYAKKQNKKLFAVPGSIYSFNSLGCHKLIKEGAKLVDNVNDILQELNLPPSFSKVKTSEEGGNSKEILILNTLTEESLTIDKIIEKTHLSAQEVASILAILEIKEKVQNLGGNIYALRH